MIANGFGVVRDLEGRIDCNGEIGVVEVLDKLSCKEDNFNRR